VIEGLAAGAPQILDLLNYIEQVEKLKTKVAFSVPTEFFSAYQQERKGLPELQFNLQVEGDDVWLRLPRLGVRRAISSGQKKPPHPEGCDGGKKAAGSEPAGDAEHDLRVERPPVGRTVRVGGVTIVEQRRS